MCPLCPGAVGCGLLLHSSRTGVQLQQLGQQQQMQQQPMMGGSGCRRSHSPQRPRRIRHRTTWWTSCDSCRACRQCGMGLAVMAVGATPSWAGAISALTAPRQSGLTCVAPAMTRVWQSAAGLGSTTCPTIVWSSSSKQAGRSCCSVVLCLVEEALGGVSARELGPLYLRRGVGACQISCVSG